MILTTRWICPKCGASSTSCCQLDHEEKLEDLKDYVVTVYCNDCEHEYGATTENSKMEIGN